MHLQADHLHLSPSDVTAFLACEHLRTLSLRAAHVEIETPVVENEQRDLIFRKGLEQFLAAPPTEPYPVDDCGMCEQDGHPLRMRTEGLDG